MGILLVLALLVLPFVLLGLAILEETLFRTGRLTEVYEFIGIYKPLKALYDLLVSISG